MIIINEERHFEYSYLERAINEIRSEEEPMPSWNHLSEAYFYWEKQVRKSLTDGEFDYNIDKFKKLLVDFKCLLDATYPREIRAFEAIGIKETV
jgi:hypothetical protein